MNFLSKILFQVANFGLFFYNLFLSILLYRNIKVYLCNHLTLGIRYIKSKQTLFPHPVGIVIGSGVVLGYGCIIYQNVTIGTKDTKNFKFAKYPSIGNNVTIYAGSIIFGDITIGDNCIIGAGSVINKNIPEGSIVAGNPAKILR